HADAEDFPGGDVAGDEVAVLRIAFFEKVPAFGVGNLAGVAGVALLAGHPDASTFAAGRLTHQPALVLAGNGGGVDLDELGVAQPGAGLVATCRGAAGADHAHRALAEHQPATAGG